MDEESEIEPVSETEELIGDTESYQTEVPPTEGAFGKYLREYRLLNSLLISLGTIVGIIGFMLAWTIIVPVGEESGSDFGDAGARSHCQFWFASSGLNILGENTFKSVIFLLSCIKFTLYLVWN